MNIEIKFANNAEKGKELVEKVNKESKIAFALVLGNTEVAKIPGISAAGAFPEITDYTPAADAELLFYGECKCIKGIPVTPQGIPTPAIITQAMLQLTSTPCFVFNSGLKVKPHLPYIDLGGKPGNDIRKRNALENPNEVFQRARIFGRELAKSFDFIFIGESVAGGTTTALALLNALGIEAKVSSSMPANPIELKKKVVKEAFERAKIKEGELKNNPLKAVELFGDPTMPAFSGLALGFAERKQAILAGGTQAGAILAICSAINRELCENIAIATTKWIIKDESSDLPGIVKQACEEAPLLYADFDFSSSKMQGLKAYESGFVKEGVGAGGAALLCALHGISKELLLETIEANLKLLLEKWKK